MIRVTQFSDCHFTTSTEPTYGGLGYDTTQAWDAIFQHAFAGVHPDLAIVTGDIADRGRADEYELARTLLGRIPVPVNLAIGNHDRHDPFQTFNVHVSIAVSERLDNWLFIFADSNFDGREATPAGFLRDRSDRIVASGELGEVELARIEQTILDSDAAHIFVWLHHPPLAPGRNNAPIYDAELARLLRRHNRIRGIAGGHMHTDTVDELESRPVFTCPAFTINIDLLTGAAQPPGYRTYEFDADGTVRSTCHFIDDPRWPRRALPEAVGSFWRGVASWSEMLAAIPLVSDHD
jgi:3',5'-cyclic-AMP phosphodiesterase